MAQTNLDSIIYTHTYYLRKEFFLRKASNPQYSLGSYAKDLNINRGQLSLIFLQKLPMTKNIEKKIEKKGLIDQSEIEKIEFFYYKYLPSLKIQTNHSFSSVFITKKTEPYSNNWLYWAVLNLLKIKNHSSDVAVISKKLSVSYSQIQKCLHDLEHAYKFITVSDKKINLLARGVHILGSTEEKLTRLPAGFQSGYKKLSSLEFKALKNGLPNYNEMNNFSTGLYCLDSKKKEEVDQLIANFLSELNTYQSTDANAHVYMLNMRLFSVTKSIQEA